MAVLTSPLLSGGFFYLIGALGAYKYGVRVLRYVYIWVLGCASTIFLLALANFISPDPALDCSKDNNGEEAPYIMGMTAQQMRVLSIAFDGFALDMGLYTFGVRYIALSSLWYHHPLAMLGIIFQSYTCLGGGMMMCMLLDSATFVVDLIDYIIIDLKLWNYVPRIVDIYLAYTQISLKEDQRAKHGSKAKLRAKKWYSRWIRVRGYYILWIMTRLVWYPIVSIWSLYTLFDYYGLSSTKKCAKFSSRLDLYIYGDCVGAICQLGPLLLVYIKDG